MVNYDMVLRFIFLTAAWSCGELDVFCLLTRFFSNWELGLIRHWIMGRGNARSCDFARDDSGVGSVPRPFLLAPCGAWVFFLGLPRTSSWAVFCRPFGAGACMRKGRASPIRSATCMYIQFSLYKVFHVEYIFAFR